MEHASDSNLLTTISILPCHSSLPANDLKLIFDATSRRKVIATTNIAETGITIDGVVFVIDCCFVKLKWYDASLSKFIFVTL